MAICVYSPELNNQGNSLIGTIALELFTTKTGLSIFFNLEDYMSALEIADIIGIICFVLSGFMMAVHHKLDILGVFIASFLTALGGGMIRDILADRTPYVFTTNLPVILVVGTVLIALLFKTSQNC